MNAALIIVLALSTAVALQRAMHYRRHSEGPVLRRPALKAPVGFWEVCNPAMPGANVGHVLPREQLTIHPAVPLGQVDLVRDVQPGDEILVWAHDRQSPLEAEYDGELWKHGTVAEIKHGIAPAAWRNVTVVFDTGKRVYSMPEAKTFLVARHGAPAAVEPVEEGPST